MKSHIPWSVKGIDPEAREAAKIAARRAGMTLGEWLNSLILQSGELPEGLAAQLAAEARREAASGERSDDENEDVEEAEELQGRLESLSRRMESSERNSALAVSGIDQSIERLAATIENSRRLLASGEVAAKSSVNELAARVESLQAQLEQMATHPRSGGGLDARTLTALEKAIAGVASHIEKSDRRNAELVQSVENAIAELTAKVGHAETASNEAIARVDIAIDRLGSRIDTTEAEQRRSSARLNERLAQLDERLATSLVQRESGIGGVERRLAGLEMRLEHTQGQIKAQIDELRARPPISPEAFTRKEFEDWTRRQASDQGASQATLRQSLANVEARIAVLGERAERLQRDGGGPSGILAERAAENARAAGERADAATRRLGEMSDELRADVAELGERLDRTNHTATETMQALEEVLRSLSRRLDTLEGRPATKPSFEPATPPVAEAVREEQPEPGPPAVAHPGWTWRDKPEDRAPAARAEHWDETSSTEEFVEVYEEEAGAPEAEEEAPALGRDFRDEEAVEERGVDLSKLNFRLEGARDRQPDADAEPPSAQPPRSEFGLFDEPEQREEHEERRTEDDSWLEQARRVAKSADRPVGDDTGTQRRSRLIYLLAAGLLVLLAAGFLAYRFLAPQPDGPGVPAQPARSGEGRVAPAPKAPEQKPPAADNRNVPPAEASQPETGMPEDVLAPREGDIGPPLPTGENSAKAETERAPAGEAPAAPTQPPAPIAKLKPEEALKAAAESGNPRAQFAYAQTLKDPRQAAEYIRKAAGQGLVIAQGRLGERYEHGNGLTASESDAAKWYERAADGGHVQSMHNFGYFNAAGMGGLKKDGVAAERWFRRAAERGLVASQVNLAIVLFSPDSFPPPEGADPAVRLRDAYFWAALAASRGDSGAEELRDTIAKDANLTSEARADIEAKIARWKPQPIDAVANGGFDLTGQSFLPADQQGPLSFNDVVEVQQMLGELGYLKGGADGKAGPQLEQAIKSFQSAYKLPVSGTADQGLIEALRVATQIQ